MIIAMVCVIGVVAGSIPFGLLWLVTLRDLHKAETERDRYWDMCNQAAWIFAAQRQGHETTPEMLADYLNLIEERHDEG